MQNQDTNADSNSVLSGTVVVRNSLPHYEHYQRDIAETPIVTNRSHRCRSENLVVSAARRQSPRLSPTHHLPHGIANAS